MLRPSLLLLGIVFADRHAAAEDSLHAAADQYNLSLASLVWRLGPETFTCTETCAAVGSSCVEKAMPLVTTASAVRAVAAAAGVECNGTVGWAYDNGPGICTNPHCCLDGSCRGICAFGDTGVRTCDGDPSGDYSRLCPCVAWAHDIPSAVGDPAVSPGSDGGEKKAGTAATLAIAWAVVGIVALVLVATAAVVWRRRRGARKLHLQGAVADDPNDRAEAGMAAPSSAAIAQAGKFAANSQALASPGAPLGISVAYLLRCFPSEAKAATGKANPCFHEICPAFASGPCGKCVSKVCPRDGLPGCSVVDALDEDQRGAATHFVSWCWGYALDDVVGAISLWVKSAGLDPSHTYLWMCFFCNNQYRLLDKGEPLSPEELQLSFAESLQKIGRMLILFNSFEDPMYIERAWCLFELFTGICDQTPTQVILPKSAETDFRHAIEGGLGLVRLRDKFGCVDVSYARASRAEDEVAIKRLIRSSVGFDVVNNCIKQKLLEWLLREFERFITKSNL